MEEVRKLVKVREDGSVLLDWEITDRIAAHSLKSHLDMLKDTNENYAKRLAEKVNKIDLMDYQYNLRMIESIKTVLEYYGVEDEGT